MGRPTHTPDPAQRRQVEALAGYGIPEAEIAGLIGCDAKTLRKHYRSELDHGHTKANGRVAENLFRKATGDGREAVVAAIFWLKTRARWRETQVSEVTHDLADPLAALLARIALQGRRLHETEEPGAGQLRVGSPAPLTCDRPILDLPVLSPPLPGRLP